MALEPGTCLGLCEIVELRGKGGLGEVYLGRDKRLDPRPGSTGDGLELQQVRR